MYCQQMNKEKAGFCSFVFGRDYNPLDNKISEKKAAVLDPLSMKKIIE